jgi:inorganic pyrophosphatase
VGLASADCEASVAVLDIGATRSARSARESRGMGMHGFPRRLPAFADDDANIVYVVIEAPAGSRNKYKFEPEIGAFALDKVLPSGTVFPYDYGFIPGTKAGDGDPVDVVVFVDAPSFPGCVNRARLVGIIRGRQTDASGQTVENDRLLAVAVSSRDHERIRRLDDIGDDVLDQLEHFFSAYHALDKSSWDATDRAGPRAALTTVRKLIDK